MKKLVLLLFFITSLTTVNAINSDFLDKIMDSFSKINTDKVPDKVKGSVSHAKKEVKNKFRDEVRNQLEKKCVKIPFFTEYYICPPINPDKI